MMPGATNLSQLQCAASALNDSFCKVCGDKGYTGTIAIDKFFTKNDWQHGRLSVGFSGPKEEKDELLNAALLALYVDGPQNFRLSRYLTQWHLHVANPATPSCPQCGSPFTVRHSSTAFGSPRYKCLVCEKRFAETSRGRPARLKEERDRVLNNKAAVKRSSSPAGPSPWG